MDVFKQNRYLQWTIVFLIVLNLATLTVLWLGRPKQPAPGRGAFPAEQGEQRIKQLLKDQLGFDDAQVERYLQLRQEHREQVERLNEEIRELKRQMFDQVLAEQAPKAISDSLLNLVLAKQAELERVTFKHFLALKDLCGPGQKEKLRLLMNEAFRPKMSPQPKGPGPNPQQPPPPPGRPE